MKSQKTSISKNKRLVRNQAGSDNATFLVPFMSNVCTEQNIVWLLLHQPSLSVHLPFSKLKKKQHNPSTTPKACPRTIANGPLWFTKLFFLVLIKIVFNSFSVNFSSTERSVELHFRWRDEHCTLEMLIDKKSDGFKVIETKLESEVSLFS